MTQFEKWCKDNGYDPKGEFTIVPSVVCSLQGRGFKGLSKETKVTVVRDEGTSVVFYSLFINGAERRFWRKFDDLIQEKQLTQFEKYCTDNGYDPEGNFKLTPEGYSHIVSFGSTLPNSAEFKRFNDDGDNKVQMVSVGCRSPGYWFRLHYLIQEKQLTQFDLTEFEKWCKDRGYDPKGEFKLTSDGKSYIKRINRENICIIDKCLKVRHDDGTRKINFVFVGTSARYWLPLHYLIQEKQLTQFEKYCKDNGYDPNGEFKLTPDGKLHLKRFYGCNDIVDKYLKVSQDDGTYRIKFVFVDTSVYHWIRLHYLIQEKKDSMIDFDYKKVLPVCWVRNYNDQSWNKRWYVANRGGSGYTVMSDCMVTTTWAQVTFEDPNDSLREDLRNQIRDYECKIAELKEVLEKMQ